MTDDLLIRITAIGHASRRWRGARNAAEAETLNQHLSDQRAQNVRRAVEDILRRELPAMKIEVPAWGVGSREPFPTASESNAAVDRSVLLMIDLTTTESAYRVQARPPRRLRAPGKIWTLKVLSMAGGGAIGGKMTSVQIAICNAYSGKQLIMSGALFGGDLGVPSPTSYFKFDDWRAPDQDPSTFLKQVGKDVTFTTEEDMDFDDWIGGDGQWVRVIHAHVKTGVTKSEATFLQFTGVDTNPGSLVFELTGLSFSIARPDVDDNFLTGKLTADGPNPGDFIEVASPGDIIPVQYARPYSEGILLSFPTGKASLHDLTADDRSRLTSFVVNKARNIGVLTKHYKVPVPAQ
jgi:hypothetical protein